MPIYLGSHKLGDICKGSGSIARGYYGSTLVYEKPQPQPGPNTVRFKFSDPDYNPNNDTWPWRTGATWTRNMSYVNENVWDYHRAFSSEYRDWSNEFYSNGQSVPIAPFMDYEHNKVTVLGFNPGYTVSPDFSTIGTAFTGDVYTMFCNNTALVGVENFMLGEAYRESGLFSNCTNLEYVHFRKYDRSTICETMRDAFDNCRNLVEIRNLDVSKVRDLYRLFGGCFELANLVDCNMSVDNATDITAMYGNCESLTQFPSHIDCTNLTDLSWVFHNCRQLVTPPTFTNTARIASITYLFNTCVNLESIPVFDTQNVENFNYAFAECRSIRSIPAMSTGKAKTVNSMFSQCINVETGALAMYNQLSTQATPPTDYYSCFRDCGSNTVTGTAELAQIPAAWK